MSELDDIINYFEWWEWVLLSLPIIYAIFIILYMRNIVVNKLKFLEENQTIDDVKEKWKPFVRYDRKNWSLCEIYFCAVFLFPIRIIIFFFLLIFVAIFSCIFSCGSRKDQTHKEQSKCKRFIFALMIKVLARIMQFCLGIWWINKKKAKIQDYDDTYPQDQKHQKQKKPSIIVANHIGYLEILHFVQSQCPSFVAKSGVAQLPMIGGIARTMQCIFVDRENNSARNSVLESILKRCENIKQGKQFPPMAMYPEGTCSNGKYLLSFKKGAFEALAPIKIFVFKFKDRHFHPYLDSIPIYYHLFLIMCQLANSYTVTELDIYYPDHLNLKNPQEDWVIYADKIKNIMIKVGQLKSSDAGYRDVMEYEDYLKNIKDKVTKKTASQQVHRSFSEDKIQYLSFSGQIIEMNTYNWESLINLFEEELQNNFNQENQEEEEDTENNKYSIQNSYINKYAQNDIQDQDYTIQSSLLNNQSQGLQNNNNKKITSNKVWSQSTDIEIKSFK